MYCNLIVGNGTVIRGPLFPTLYICAWIFARCLQLVFCIHLFCDSAHPIDWLHPSYWHKLTVWVYGWHEIVAGNKIWIASSKWLCVCWWSGINYVGGIICWFYHANSALFNYRLSINFLNSRSFLINDQSTCLHHNYVRVGYQSYSWIPVFCMTAFLTFTWFILHQILRLPVHWRGARQRSS